MIGSVCVLISFPFIFIHPIGLSVKNCQNVASTVNPLETTPSPSTVNASSRPGKDCDDQGDIAVTAYYSALFVLLNIGVAAVQIGHLSMIPDITSKENSRMVLTSTRHGATVTTNVLVYSVTWLLLETSK